jgi:hypothetical protein
LYGRKDERLIVKDLEGSARGPTEIMIGIFLRKTSKSLVRIAGVRAEIRNQRLRNAYLEQLSRYHVSVPPGFVLYLIHFHDRFQTTFLILKN